MYFVLVAEHSDQEKDREEENPDNRPTFSQEQVKEAIETIGKEYTCRAAEPTGDPAPPSPVNQQFQFKNQIFDLSKCTSRVQVIILFHKINKSCNKRDSRGVNPQNLSY